MEYQIIANLIDDASSQPSKFRTRYWVEINDEAKGTKYWVEINDEARGTYNANSQIKFETS